LAIDTAEKRRSISGIPLLSPGVTPNASKDAEWRRESAWGYYLVTVIPVYTITEEPLDLAASPGLVSLDSPMDTVMVNYIAMYILTDQDGKILTDQDGKILRARVRNTTRTNIVDLGA
jgi:hypothetical protein